MDSFPSNSFGFIALPALCLGECAAVLGAATGGTTGGLTGGGSLLAGGGGLLAAGCGALLLLGGGGLLPDALVPAPSCCAGGDALLPVDCWTTLAPLLSLAG